VANVSPFGEYAMAEMGRVWARKFITGALVAESQQDSMPSSEPDSQCFPPGETAQEARALGEALKAATGTPWLLSHQRK
jgi:hypothetical protein